MDEPHRTYVCVPRWLVHVSRLPSATSRTFVFHRSRPFEQVAETFQAPGVLFLVSKAHMVSPAWAPSKRITAGTKPFRLEPAEHALTSAAQTPTKFPDGFVVEPNKLFSVCSSQRSCAKIMSFLECS